MPPLDQIRQSIEARLSELKNEITTLQAARDALYAKRTATAAPAPARQASAKAARRPAQPRRARATPARSEPRVEVLLADKLEAMLAQAPEGLSAITISKRANASYNQVRELLRECEGSGQVRRTGTRRTSLWQLITEEEQIAERAAELERLSLARSGR